MSTISLPNEKQIRHFFLANAIATETDIASFISGASIGEVQIFDEDGNAIDYTSGALLNKDFYIAKVNNKGGISKSDLITPKDITYLRGTAPVAKTGKTQIFTLSGAPTAGDEYIFSLKLNYHNSEENFITFTVGTVAVSGDTTTTLLTRVAKQLADNLAASINTSTKVSGTDTIIVGTTALKNKYFTITVAGSAMTIAEKDWILEDFRVGLRTQDQLMWNGEMLGGTAAVANTVKTATEPVFAKGQGYQIIELERYLVGHRAEFETKDHTLSFNRSYDTDINASYYCLDLKYFDISRDDPKHSDKMLTIVSEDELVIDAIGFAIEAAMGLSEGDLWVELDPNADGADNA